MKKKSLIFKFTDSGKEYLFEDKVFVIENNKLIENLEKPSIKNSESKLVIKSLNDTHVSDVIQIKVNMSETGYFLVSFAKDSLDEDKRKILLEEIGTLKSNATRTNSTQLKKAKSLCEILNKYKPIYAVFINNGQFKVNISKLSLEEFKFPLLVLNKPEKKKILIASKQKKEKPVKETKSKKDRPSNPEKPKHVYSPFALFEVDYVFVLLFALLGAFGTITCIFEIMNKEMIAIFLGILAVAFVIVLAISVHSTAYKKGKLINPWLKVYLCLYILIGIAGGIVAGYFISKGVLKTEIEDFDYEKLLKLSIIISTPALLSSMFTSFLINLIVKKKYK